MKRKLLVSSVALAVALIASAPVGASDYAPAGETELGAWGVDLEEMAADTKPGDDFFYYVNGQWLDTFEIPADFTNYGAFTALFERSEQRVADIIAAAAAAPNSDLERKIAGFYGAFVDTEEITRTGLKNAKADFEFLKSLKTHQDIARAMGRPDLALPSPIGPFVGVDEKSPDRYAVYFTQSGLGMPYRDYYLDEKYAVLRTAYRDLIQEISGLAGITINREAADRILALEVEIARLHWPLEKQRDRDLTYNPVSGASLAKEYPGFPWRAFLSSASVPEQPAYIVSEPDAVAGLATLFQDTPPAVWRDYLTFHYLHGFAGVLSMEIDNANFEFFGKALHGQQEQRPRAKRAVAAVNSALGEAVGRIYADQYFPPDAKAKMDTLIANVVAAFDERIRALEWMSEDTKREALVKLASFKPFIGGPEKWRDYADLDVDPENALANMKASNASQHAYYVSRLGRPVDPANEWGMTPQTVNAYYSPPRNAIYFPAAILQPPFFDPNADPAVNYGGIAAVIGHEIGHGFDDQGRKSDGAGVLRDWWTEEDNSRFQALADRLGRQFAAYSPLEGYTINPDLTMGENIGDLGGLAVAYHAYRKSLGGKEAEVIDGFTGDQRFFLSYGQIWRRKHREEDLRMRLLSDPHSPAEYRVNGIVRNFGPWYAAFNVQPGDRLYLPPSERVNIW